MTKVQYKLELIKHLGHKDQPEMVRDMYQKLVNIIEGMVRDWTIIDQEYCNLKYVTSGAMGTMKSGHKPDIGELVASTGKIRSSLERFNQGVESSCLLLNFLRAFVDQDLPYFEFTEYLNKNIKPLI